MSEKELILDEEKCVECPWRGMCLSEGPGTVLMAVRATGRAEDVPCKLGVRFGRLLREMKKELETAVQSASSARSASQSEKRS